ncbi:MAG TPA: glycosyltransferase family 39 protein [Terriglobales bacterium]|nr:glycosyltransferase family 39 protein [Terriglobales bacterium]
MNIRSRISDYILLIAVAAFFLSWKLSAFGLIGADEPRYAQVAREMLERHDWVTSTLGGLPWLEKPPLYYWQAMLAYKLFGVSDWAARLPSVLDAFLLLLVVYFFLRRFRGGFELDGTLIVATSAGIVGFSRAASTDMPLTAAFTISMLGWCAWFESRNRKWLLAFYGFIALAMLAKGPVAPFLAAAVIATFAAVNRSANLIRKTLWLPGILLFCVIALPWYALVQFRNPQFFHEFIIEHNLARFGTNLYHHPEPFWYYVPVTLLAWVPWTVFVLPAGVWATVQLRKSATGTVRLFLLIWIAVVVIFFSISQSKLPGYVLPAIPPGALLATEFIHDRGLSERSRALKRVLLFAVHSAVLGVLVFCALMIQPLILEHRIPWNLASIPFTVASIIAAAGFVLLLKFDLRALRFATLVPMIVAVAIALRFGAGPLDATLSARPVASQLAQFDAQHLPAALFLVPRETEFGIEFYRNQATPRYELRQIPAGEHLVVAARGFEKSIAAATGRRPVYLGSFQPQKLEFFYVPASR